MSKKKYLIETSVLPAALGNSTPKHCQHFTEEVKDGALYGSVYIRMEYIRRWFCDAVRIAFTIEHFSSVADALFYLEQDFSPRQVKGDINRVAAYLRDVGAIDNTRAAAEAYGSMALRHLKNFDLMFSARVQNVCGCQIGGKVPQVDYNHLLKDLHDFYKAFNTPITNCDVNAFLQLQDNNGRTASLLGDADVAALPVGKRLAKLRDKAAWVTCRECSHIGDAVIALEQPQSWCLVHLDGSFNDLCRVRIRDHKQLRSARAFDKELQQVLNPKPGTEQSDSPDNPA